MFSFFHRSQISYRVVILWELQPFYSCAVIFDRFRHLRMKNKVPSAASPLLQKNFLFWGLSVVSGAVFVWNLPNAYAIILLSKEILGGLRHLALSADGFHLQEPARCPDGQDHRGCRALLHLRHPDGHGPAPSGLLALGCRYAQGFFYGRPEPAENFLKPL